MTMEASIQGAVTAPSLPQRLWVAVSAVFAGIVGVAPHVLHHVGPLAGAALFAGAGGSILFAAIGFAAAIPFLVRLRRHCGNWRVPGMALAAMAVMFSLSTFVIGPAIAGSSDESDQPAPLQQETLRPAPGDAGGHEAHH